MGQIHTGVEESEEVPLEIPFEEIAGYPYDNTADYSHVGQIHREGYAQRLDYRDYRGGRTYGPPAGERMPHTTGNSMAHDDFTRGKWDISLMVDTQTLTEIEMAGHLEDIRLVLHNRSTTDIQTPRNRDTVIQHRNRDINNWAVFPRALLGTIRIVSGSRGGSV